MSSRSYIISNYKVSKTLQQFIEAKLRGVTPEQRRFFLHLLCSHLLDLGHQRYEVLPGWDSLGVKLPSVTIRAEFERGFSWHALEDKGLIEASDFCKGECRYFLVSTPLFQEILAEVQRLLAAPDGSPAVNLFDGTAYNVSHAVTAKGARPSSKVMRDAMRVLHASECPINVRAVQEHLARLECVGDALALQNDRLCAQAMFAGMKRMGDHGLYIPSYASQSSGRIGELGGGVQSCSRAMKQAAFEGIDNLFNYDLRSSQGYVLLQELHLAGIDDTWLGAHLGPGLFEERADQLDLPKKLYKRLFFSTIMGASHIWLEGEHVGAIQEGLLEHYGTVKPARAKFGQVVNQLRPLKEAVGKWAEWLINDPVCPHRKQSQRREYLENASGQKYIIDRKRREQELKREGAAHMLQGQEAAYIHHLTVLSKKHSFVPVSNQHDGLITLGAVPEEAMATAAKLSGLAFAFLERKAFV